jgi:phage terminase small subunit
MNKPLTKSQHEARGTDRKDREHTYAEERDPSETKPRRPSELEGHAAKFWYLHVDQLWDSGWLKKSNADVFVKLCNQWRRMEELEEFLDTEGAFTYENSQSGPKRIERPESKAFNKLYESNMKKCAMIGIISDKPATLAPKDKKKPNAKPSIGEFEKGGPIGLAK